MLRRLGQEFPGFLSRHRLAFVVEAGKALEDHVSEIADMSNDNRCKVFCGGDVKAFLATEIIGDRLQVYAGSLREPPRAGAIEPVAAEDIDGTRQKLFTRDIAAVLLGCLGRGFVFHHVLKLHHSID
ncbi:hypothetical protein D9M70_479010 [compost metagenome]